MRPRAGRFWRPCLNTHMPWRNAYAQDKRRAELTHRQAVNAAVTKSAPDSSDPSARAIACTRPARTRQRAPSLRQPGGGAPKRRQRTCTAQRDDACPPSRHCRGCAERERLERLRRTLAALAAAAVSRRTRADRTLRALWTCTAACKLEPNWNLGTRRIYVTLKQKVPHVRDFCESGRQDLNLRPPGPQPGALPDCATPRGALDSERATGIEPALRAWKAPVQPQHFARKAPSKRT